ncbi:MAG: outer membrane lipoprotein-sorting protein [bacterium]|nr:outer membrane lipoprotein-sorting protein [bacterium]
MTVKRPEWERTLDMNFWQITPEKTLILITGPAKERGTGTLRIESNMWLYMPRVERTIKIPPSLMLQPWMGSDFTNDDLVKESSLVHDYTHAVDGEVTEDGDACYRLVATPKPDAAVVWGKLVLLVRKSDSLPRKQEFYDERGRLQKVMTFEDVRRIGDRYYPMRWRMVPVNKPNHETMLVYTEIAFDRKIPARIFTQQNLKRRF